MFSRDDLYAYSWPDNGNKLWKNALGEKMSFFINLTIILAVIFVVLMILFIVYFIWVGFAFENKYKELCKELGGKKVNINGEILCYKNGVLYEIVNIDNKFKLARR